MRRITVSVFALFIILPVYGNARLPVVNVAAGGVSARAAFGETVTPAAPVVTSKAQSTRRLVARPAAPAPVVASADVGASIASNDVLAPRRPSHDLWAQNDAPLRMPNVDEFRVVRSDAALPEESLDGRSVSQKTASRVASAAPVSHSVTSSTPMSEIDTQIARLNELQRRADDNVRAMNRVAASDVMPRPSVDTSATRAVAETRDVIASAKAASARVAPRDAADASPVSISRMVVPMDDMSNDVVVRAVQKNESPRLVATREDMTNMTPAELRRAFRKTFLSENKHLSTFQIDERFDVASDMSSDVEGFTSRRDLSETGGIRPLEIKIKFRNDDSSLSRNNYNLLTEYAGIVTSNPTRAVQVSIPASAVTDSDERKLAARRLALIEQVLRDNGVSEYRIMPVLSQRSEEDFVLRMISSQQYESLSQQKRDIFGDTIGKKKTYKSMTW